MGDENRIHIGNFFVWCAFYVTCVQRNARFRMTPKIYDAESVSLDEALGIDTVWDRAGDTRDSHLLW